MSNKVKIGALVFLIIVLYGGFKMYASSIAKDKIDEAIAEHVPADELSIDYKNISVDLLGLGVHINDIVVSSPDGEHSFKINEVFLADFDDKSEIPTNLDISVNGVHIEELVKEFSRADKKKIKLAFGMKNTTDPVLLNSSLKYNYNDNKEIKYEMAVGADNVGNMRAKIHVGGIKKPTKANIDNPLAGTDKASIIAISLGYEDDSLIERLLEEAAKEEHTDVGGLKEKLKKELHKNTDNQGELAQEHVKKLEKFIDDPDSISITVKPQEPLVVKETIGNVLAGKQSFEDVLKNLNLELDVG